jgi:hypothetical protein
MVKTALAASLLLLLVAPGTSADTISESISWAPSYEVGLAQAKTTNRHLVVDFYTPT